MSIEFRIDKRKILKHAKGFRSINKDISELPLGPSVECFSAWKISKIIQAGAVGEDREHLLKCSACLDLIRKMGKVNIKSDPEFIERAIKKAMMDSQESEIVNNDKNDFYPRQAVLALSKKTIVVGSDKSIKIDVVPVFKPDLLNELEIDSLRLRGALITKETPRIKQNDIDHDGNPDFITMTFKEPQPSRKVARNIQSHRYVVDKLFLMGRFRDLPNESILGQINVKFKSKTATAV